MSSVPDTTASRDVPQPAGRVGTRFAVHYFMLFVMIATITPYVQVFLRARGFSDAEVGYLQGIMGLAGTVGPVLIGYAADRVGRRAALIACVVGFAVLPPLLNITTCFITAAALISGVGLLARTTIPLTDTLAAAELPDPARDYGRVRVWGSVGFVAALLGIRAFGLVDEGSSSSVMATMVVGAALCFMSSLLLPERKRIDAGAGHTCDGGGSGTCFDGVFWVFMIAVATHRLGMSAYYFFFTNFLRDSLGMEQAAWIWALGALAELPFLFCGGWLIRRLGIRCMLVISMVTISIRLALYATIPPLGVILVSQVLHGLIFGLCHAASIEFLRRKVRAERRGLAMALYMALPLGLSNFLGSAVGGIVVERWGYARLYAVYALPPLVGVACILLAGRAIEAAGE